MFETEVAFSLFLLNAASFLLFILPRVSSLLNALTEVTRGVWFRSSSVVDQESYNLGYEPLKGFSILETSNREIFSSLFLSYFASLSTNTHES
jgi:hypothetical protein